MNDEESTVTEDVPVTGDVIFYEELAVSVSAQMREHEGAPVATGDVMLYEELADMDPFTAIIMPPTICKRGRPKGSDTTVIGVPKKRCNKKSP